MSRDLLAVASLNMDRFGKVVHLNGIIIIILDTVLGIMLNCRV